MIVTAEGPSTQARRSTTTLVAVVLAVLATLVAAGLRVGAYASTNVGSVAGNVVAAHDHPGGPLVAAPERVPAGEDRGATTPAPDVVSGSHVAPRATAGASRGGDDFVEFAHGTRADYARAIVDDGVSARSIKASEFGSAEPGSFFTVKVDPNNPMDALETAAAWGARHGGDTCVVVCRIPRSLATRLEQAGQLVHHNIPYESVFRPRAFGALNQHKHLWKIIPRR